MCELPPWPNWPRPVYFVWEMIPSHFTAFYSILHQKFDLMVIKPVKMHYYRAIFSY